MCYYCQKLFTNLWSKGIPCWLSKTSNILPFETETVAAHMFLLPPVINFWLKKWSLAQYYSLFMYQHQFVITVFNPVCMCHRAKQILPPLPKHRFQYCFCFTQHPQLQIECWFKLLIFWRLKEILELSLPALKQQTT